MSRRVDAIYVAVVHHDPRLVQRRPRTHSGERATDDTGVVGEPARDVAVQKAAPVLEGRRQVPVEQRSERLDSRVEERIDETPIEIQALLVQAPDAFGEDAAPGDAEPVRVEREAPHERDVLWITVVVVARDVAVVAAVHVTRRVREPVPVARPCPVGERRALDLIGGGRGSPEESLRKSEVRRHVRFRSTQRSSLCRAAAALNCPRPHRVCP